MSMFDNILGNLDDIAGKIGLPADKVQGFVEAAQARLAAGGDQLAGLTEVAREHGVSLDNVKAMLANAGEGAQGMLGKITGALDKDGDGNPLNDLTGMVKGLFGKE